MASNGFKKFIAKIICCCYGHERENGDIETVRKTAVEDIDNSLKVAANFSQEAIHDIVNALAQLAKEGVRNSEHLTSTQKNQIISGMIEKAVTRINNATDSTIKELEIRAENFVKEESIEIVKNLDNEYARITAEAMPIDIATITGETVQPA